MNYETDILPLEGDGVTDEGILSTLQASGVTNKPIDRATLLHTLNMLGMLQKRVSNNADEKWSGSVLNMQTAIIANGTQAQIDGIRLWLSHVTNPTNTVWDTTKSEYAAPFWEMYQAFKDIPTMPTTEDFKALAELGGGWAYADVTTEDVEKCRDDYNNLEASQIRLASLQAVMDEIENIRSAAVAGGDDATTLREAIAEAM